MIENVYVKMTLEVQNDIKYHLTHVADGLRASMEVANQAGSYGREAELGDMLTHTLLALANLPLGSGDLPF
jgi:hypothetical protein